MTAFDFQLCNHCRDRISPQPDEGQRLNYSVAFVIQFLHPCERCSERFQELLQYEKVSLYWVHG